MRKKYSLFFLIILLFSRCYAQSFISNRALASQQIKALKEGALVVRLKTNDRSIDAYRKAGQKELAEKLTEEKRKQNQKLMDAFRSNLDFCKVYFIFSKNTDELLKGNQHIFLNDTLALDTSIHLTEKYFLIAEYGFTSVNAPSAPDDYRRLNQTEASSTTASTSAVFISDTSLKQLKEPFPFYQTVYLDNFSKSVERMNNMLHKAFFKLDNSAKEERKKLREQLKKLR